MSTAVNWRHGGDDGVRLVPGVLSDAECYTGESHWNGLWSTPVTRPEVWEPAGAGGAYPGATTIKVDEWRREMCIKRTMEKRPIC